MTNQALMRRKVLWEWNLRNTAWYKCLGWTFGCAPVLWQRHVCVASLPAPRQSVSDSTDRPSACILLAFLHHLMVSRCFADYEKNKPSWCCLAASKQRLVLNLAWLLRQSHGLCVRWLRTALSDFLPFSLNPPKRGPHPVGDGRSLQTLTTLHAALF